MFETYFGREIGRRECVMLVDFRDEKRVFLGRVGVDVGEEEGERCAVVELPSNEAGLSERELQWEGALDDAGLVQRCISCGCKELFVRKDFPQVLGMGLVIGAAGLSVVFFALGQVFWSIAILVGAVGVDSLIFYFTPKCVVCYRCRTEYHGCGIGEELEAWDLSLGEKYRPVRVDAGEAGAFKGIDVGGVDE